MNKIASALLLFLLILPSSAKAAGLENKAFSSEAWHLGIEEGIPDFLAPISLLIPPSLNDNAPLRKADPLERGGATFSTWVYPTRQSDAVIESQPAAR